MATAGNPFDCRGHFFLSQNSNEGFMHPYQLTLNQKSRNNHVPSHMELDVTSYKHTVKPALNDHRFKRPPAFSDRFFMHGEFCHSNCTVLGDHLPNATSDRHFLHQRPDFPSLATKSKERRCFVPIFTVKTATTAQVCEKTIARGGRLHQIDVYCHCVDQTRAYHNVRSRSTELRKIGLFRGNLALETTCL